MKTFGIGVMVGILAATTAAFAQSRYVTTLDQHDQWLYLSGWQVGYVVAALHVVHMKNNPDPVEGMKFLQRSWLRVQGCFLADVHHGAQGVVITYDQTHNIAEYVATARGDEDSLIETAMIKCGGK